MSAPQEAEEEQEDSVLGGQQPLRFGAAAEFLVDALERVRIRHKSRACRRSLRPTGLSMLRASGTGTHGSTQDGQAAVVR